MFKNLILFCMILIGCPFAFGEISEDELDEYSDVIEIDGVTERSDERRDQEYEILEIRFSGGNDRDDVKYLPKIQIRFAVEITDKKTKKTFLFEKQREHGDFSNFGDRYEGEGYWTLEIPHIPRIERLEISAYSLQYGVMDGETFIPFEEEFDDVDSYEELIERTKTPYPTDCSLRSTVYVDG